MKTDKSKYRQALKFLGSNRFFWIIVAVFVLQAVWLACSALYPMAFDEDFHFGLIKLYAHHISPFWSGHPAGADAFGALTRDPSYLYQYLMSFPYRLISALTSNQTAQVMTLRFINIALVAWSLVLYRRLLLKTRASGALVNLSLLVFILVPILPYLAAQINYDNLLLPLVAWALLLTLKLRDSFRNNRLDVKTMLILTSVMLGSSLVKYAFLPIFITILAFLLYSAYMVYRTPVNLWRAIVIGSKAISLRVLLLLAALILLTGGLFVERYGVNLTKYHAPVADCGDVLDYDHCKSYGPWIRDYYLEQNKTDGPLSPLAFNNDWFKGMWFRSFFAISGATNGFQNSGPLTWPAVGTIFFAAAGILAFVFNLKRLFRRYSPQALGLFLGVSLLYTAVLWLDNYKMYKHTGIAVAINGRYLLPIVPLAVLMTALALNEALRARTWLKVALATVVVICYVWGGGALTWILRSHDAWYWSGGPLSGSNRFIQRNIGPYVPGYRHPEQYMP